MNNLKELLDQSASRHAHLCPRQVLGVRMGMLAGELLKLDLPQVNKRLFAFVESDGCGMGGIEIATGCRADRRTLRIVDYGKMAASFVDTQTGECLRIRPHPDSRISAGKYAPKAIDAWHCQLDAYQIIPFEELFEVQPIRLSISLEKIISEPGLRAFCVACGEEITNEREVVEGGRILCRSCAGDRYYISLIT